MRSNTKKNNKDNHRGEKFVDVTNCHSWQDNHYRFSVIVTRLAAAAAGDDCGGKKTSLFMICVCYLNSVFVSVIFKVTADYIRENESDTSIKW